ncbi:MAG TPA: Eco29kI family restriction endonuclease [bacterium]|jgi:hypothetical protein|nr:Eco29kI family restriction endonuclease [bacterium]
MTSKKKLKDILTAIGVDEGNLTSKTASLVGEAVQELEGYLASVREFKAPLFVFDPTDSVAASFVIATAMFAMPRRPLADLESVTGSGIYALFYRGSYPAYAGIKGKDTPIYIGSAAPAHRQAKNPEAQGPALHSRLSTHRKNILAVENHHKADSHNLRVADFEYRLLVIKSGWEKSSEDFLIEFFKPVWNNESKVCYGIGKHGDSSKTRDNTRSPWDTLHPGRKWALDAKPGRTAAQIVEAVRAHLDIFGGRRLDGKALLELLAGGARSGGPSVGSPDGDSE